MLAGELQGLGQVGLPVSQRRGPVRAHLEYYVAREAGAGEPPQQVAARLCAATRNQMLIRQARLSAVAQVHVAEPAAKLPGHRKHVRTRNGGVGDVESDGR